ncbi:hypothetical protein GU700_11025 [Methylobacterium sp. NI91]|nr:MULTISPECIES: hypothetical protein [unclassified Methylobacterium]QIJ75075.1 hypothetical protein CLZ_11025 [Methylobacterium sp. CLZ]QIJ79979.1 hypothetical protein GU700_11025 [Methylobacterium sp. NI91]
MVDNRNTTEQISAKSHQQIGPVTLALRAMRDTPERREIQALRDAIAERIERDIELLDRRDAGEFRV